MAMDPVFLKREPVISPALPDQVDPVFMKPSVIQDKPTGPLLGPPERRTWTDAFADVAENPHSYLPYINALDLVKTGKVYMAAKAYEAGTATPEQEAYLNSFLADRQRESSLGYKAWSTALRMPAYALEFLTAGGFIKGLAKGTIMKTAKKGGKKALGEILEKSALKGSQKLGAKVALKLGANVNKGTVGYKLASFLAEDTGARLGTIGTRWLDAKQAGNIPRLFTAGTEGAATLTASDALKSATFGAARRHVGRIALAVTPRTILQTHRVADGIVQNMTPVYGLSEDEQGMLHKVLIDDGDDFLPAFAKAFGDVAIENFSEETAETFVLLKGLFGADALKFVKGSFLHQAAEKIAKASGRETSSTVKDILRNIFLGREGRRGFVEKIGWHGVLGELGEEAVGGALRQMTGISPIGLPELEDVAAMAIGFAINPLAIGGYAYESGMDLYIDKTKNISEVISKVRADPGMLKDPKLAEGPKQMLKDYLDFYREEEQGNLSMMEKFMRVVFFNNLQRKIGERMGEQLAPELSKELKEEVGFDRVRYTQQLLERTARNYKGEFDDKVLTILMEALMGFRVATPEMAKFIEQQALKGEEGGKQWEDGSLKGFYQGKEELFSKIVYVQQGDLPREVFDAMLKTVPWLVEAKKFDNFDVNGRVVDRQNTLPDVTDKKKYDDAFVHQLAQEMGVLQVQGQDIGIGKSKRLGYILVDDMDTLRAKVARKAKRINSIARNLPEGRRIVVTPTIAILDTRENLSGYPLAESVQAFNNKDEILLTVGAHYNEATDTIYISQASSMSDISEDVIESIADVNDQFVQNFADAVIKSSPEAEQMLGEASKMEIFSKVVKRLVFNQEASGANDLSAFVDKLGLDIDKLVDGGAAAVSGYLEWRAEQQGASSKLLEALAERDAAFSSGQEYEHLGYNPKFSLGDLLTHADTYKGKRSQPVDKNFSLQLNYTPKLHQERYLGRTRNYLLDSYNKQRNELDDKQFIESMIDLHGRTIVPFLKRFFEELYEGTIQITPEAKRARREAKAKPAPKEKAPVQKEEPAPEEAIPTVPLVKRLARIAREAVPEAEVSVVDTEALARRFAEQRAEPTEVDINTITEHKGIPVTKRSIKGKHPVHGGTPSAMLIRKPDGTAEIIIDTAKVAQNFRDKIWTKPRLEGTTPLAEDAFETLNEWLEFILEHEYLHSVSPQIKSDEPGYVQNENLINYQATRNIGIFEKAFPEVAEAVALEEPLPEAPPEVTEEEPPQQVSLETTPEEIRRLSEETKAKLSKEAKANVEKLEARYNNMPIKQIIRNVIDNFSLKVPEEIDSTKISEIGAQLGDKINILDDIKRGRIESSDGEIISTIIGDNLESKLLSKISEVTKLIDEFSDDVSDSGNDIFYKEAKLRRKQILGIDIDKSDKLTKEELAAIESIETPMNAEPEGRIVMASVRLFFDSVWKVDYKHAMLSDVGDLISINRSYDGAPWTFLNTGTNRMPAILLHSMGLYYLVNSGRNFYFIEGSRVKYGSKYQTRTIKEMTDTDRRRLQHSLWQKSKNKETFDFIISRFGEKAITPVVSMPRLEGDTLEREKKAFTSRYNKLSEGAKTIVANPEDLKTDEAWNIAIARDIIWRELYGSYEVFKSDKGYHQEMMKRTDKIFTPGLNPNIPASYLVFEDNNEFDGMTLFTDDTYGREYNDAVGYIFSDPDASNFIKQFFVYKTDKGNAVQIKPLMFNVNVLQGKPYYDELKARLDELNAESPVPLILIPTSSVKLAGERIGEDAEIKTAGIFKNGKLELDADYADKIETIPPEANVLTGNFDFGLTPEANELLIQVKSLDLLYDSPDILAATKLYNEAFDQILRHKAEKLTFEDIMDDLSENPIDDDKDKFSELQRLMRAGLTTEELIKSADQIHATTVLASVMANVMTSKANRTLKVSTAPGEDFDKTRTTRPDENGGILPATADSGRIDTEEDFISWDDNPAGRRQMWNDRRFYPFLFKIDQDGNPINELQEKFIKRKGGKIYAPRDVARLTRVPASSPAFTVVTQLASDRMNSIASFVITDKETNAGKGEDFDGDFTFEDGLFRYVREDGSLGKVILRGKSEGAKAAALANRAFLLTIQGQLNMSPEMLAASKEAPAVDIFDKIIEKETTRREEEGITDPALMTEEGQTFWDNNVTESKKALGIAAAQSSVMRTMEYLNISSDKSFTVSKALGIEWSRTKEQVDSMTHSQKVIRDKYFNNVLINMYVDNLNDPKMQFLRHDRDTVPLLYAMIAGNLNLREKEDIVEFMDKAYEYFGSPLIMDYKDLSRQQRNGTDPLVPSYGKDDIIDKLNKRALKKGARYSSEDVDGLSRLLAVNDDLREFKQMLSIINGEYLGNITSFNNASNFVDYFERGSSRMFNLAGVIDSERGEVIRVARDIVGIYNRKIFSNDITVSQLGQELTDHIFATNERSYTPKVLKDLFMQTAAINAVDQGAGFKRKQLQNMIQGHRKAHKDNEFIKRLTVRQGRIGLKPKLNFGSGQDLRDAFEELPDDVKRDLLLYQIHTYGISGSYLKGGYMRLIGDATYEQFNRDFIAQLDAWHFDNVPQEVVDNMKDFMPRKLRKYTLAYDPVDITVEEDEVAVDAYSTPESEEANIDTEDITPAPEEIAEAPAGAPSLAVPEDTEEPYFSLVSTGVSEGGEVSLKFSWSDNPKVMQKLRGWAKRGNVNDRNGFVSALSPFMTKKEAGIVFDMLKAHEWTREDDIVEEIHEIEKNVLSGISIERFSGTQELEDDLFTGRQILGEPAAVYEGLSVNKGQGEYKEYFIKAPFPVPGQHGEFQDPNLAGWFRVREYQLGRSPDAWNRAMGTVQVGPDQYVRRLEGGFRFVDEENQTGRQIDEAEAVRLLRAVGFKIPRDIEEPYVEIQEIQSELFQKHKAGFVHDEGYPAYPSDAPIVDTAQQAAFLNLLVENQTWVPVFVSAITQWAEQQGFTKVRFPTGDTAAKVEGHQAIADRLTALHEERETIDDRLAPKKAAMERTAAMLEARGDFQNASGIREDMARLRTRADIDAEIQNLKTQGIEKLAPIEAFYENRIGKLVKRMGAVPVTDANGNTWNELTVPSEPQRITTPPAEPAPAFSLTWNNAVTTEAWVEARRRYDDPAKQRIYAGNFNKKWRNVVQLIERNPDRADEIANNYHLPQRLRDKVNRLLYVDNNEARIRDPELVDNQQYEFQYSLKPWQDTIKDMPQFYTSAEKALHIVWVEMRNKMESEVIYGRAAADRMLRIARGLSGDGYVYKKQPDGTYTVYDADNEMAKVKDAEGLTKQEAIMKVKARDSKLRKEKLLSEEQVAQIMSAATERREKPDANKFLHVTSTGPAKEDATVSDLPIQPVIDLIGEERFNKIVNIIDKTMKRREVVVADMEALAGPDWINEWKKYDATGEVRANYIPHFYRREGGPDASIGSRNQEDSKHAQARKYDSYRIAYETAGYIPQTTDASELTRKWFEDAWGAAVNRTMITLGANMRDVDAAPLWIPTFKLPADIDQEYEPAYATGMNENQIKLLYDNLLSHLETLGLRQNRSVYIPKTDRAELMVNNLVAGNAELLRSAGYKQLKIGDSGFRSIQNWYVKPGNPQENLLKMLENRPLEWRFFGGRNWAVGINRFNNWSKNTALSLSLFHPVALVESLLAIGGIGVKNWKAIAHTPETVAEIKNMFRLARNNPDILKKWIGHGMRMNPTNPNFDDNQLWKDIRLFENKFDDMGLTYLKKVTGVWKWYNRKVNRGLWSQFFPAIKLWAAENVYNELIQNYEERGISYDNDQVLTDISQMVNDAFGGQNWDQYLWATPERKQLLHLLMFAPDWCCSSDTRAMTKTGWKYHHELERGDEILIHDPKTNTNRWGKLKDKYERDSFCGDMVRIKNYNKSILVTPEHTCRVVHDKTKKVSTIKAKELNTHHMIPRSAPMNLPEKEVLDDKLIRIVGWMVTDGSYCYSSWRTKANGSRVRYQYGRICQNKHSGISDLDDIGLNYYEEDSLKGSHDKYHNNRPTRRYYVSARHIKAMHSAGIKDNNLTWEFLSKLTRRQLELLYRTMMLGDGTGQNRFCGKEHEVFNMTLIQTMLGKPTTFYQQEKDCWRTRTISSNFITCAGNRKTTEHYEGTIWCPSVETGFWVAERNGLVFITGNTLSAFNISGAPNLPVFRDFIKQPALQKKWQLERYWPGMVVLVMAGLPQAVQLAIYSMSKIMPGPDDEEAKPFLFQNESGMEGIGGIGAYIDVTPLLKKLGYRGEPTGKRRMYIRWAKQANEVFEGWGTRPLKTLMAKSSSAVKVVIEQMTGTNTAGWALGFKEKNLMTGLFSGEEGFSDSRVAYIGRKLFPMSILSFLEGRPSTFFAPAKKGMSNYVAQRKMAQVLTAYAEDDVWNRIKKNRQWKANLEVLGPGLLEAAERNGLDPEMVLKAAKRHTLAHLYNRFFRELNDSDYSALDKTANAILRVNGTIDGLERSLKGRFEKTQREFSAEHLEAMKKAFE